MSPHLGTQCLQKNAKLPPRQVIISTEKAFLSEWCVTMRQVLDKSTLDSTGYRKEGKLDAETRWGAS